MRVQVQGSGIATARMQGASDLFLDYFLRDGSFFKSCTGAEIFAVYSRSLFSKLVKKYSY